MFPTTSVPFQIVMKYDDSETVISLRASARGSHYIVSHAKSIRIITIWANLYFGGGFGDQIGKILSETLAVTQHYPN